MNSNKHFKAIAAMSLNRVIGAWNDLLEDFTLEGYDPPPGIKAPIAV